MLMEISFLTEPDLQELMLMEQFQQDRAEYRLMANLPDLLVAKQQDLRVLKQ